MHVAIAIYIVFQLAVVSIHDDIIFTPIGHAALANSGDCP